MKIQVALLLLVTCFALICAKSTWRRDEKEGSKSSVVDRMRKLFSEKRGRDSKNGSDRSGGRSSGGKKADGEEGSTRIAPGASRTSSTDCVLVTVSGDIIKSLNHPSNYPNRHDKCWKLQAPEGKFPSIEFSAFVLESHSRCYYDYVELYDGDFVSPIHLIGGRHCGTNSPGTVIGKQRTMLVKFRTDYSVVKTGFQATFTFSDVPGSHESSVVCTEVAEAGVIKSQNYPSNYPNSLIQCWILLALPSETATLTFTDFNLESNSACRYDSVEIFEGLHYDPSNQIGSKHCGQSTPPVATTTGEGFLVYFKTDSSVTKKGFSATFVPSSGGGDGGSDGGGSGDSSAFPCGVPQVASTRIVGGEEAEPHSWPWQISLKKYYGGSWRHICGGSIVAEKWVITAAHCVDSTSASSIRVTIGEHNRNVVEGPEQTIEVTRIIVHNEYNSPTWNDHDIALLELVDTITFSDTALPVCLPSASDPPVGTECYTTGWGETNTASGPTGDRTKLLQVVLPIVAHSQCVSWYSTTVSENMICAGYPEGQMGACRGDSGGPLVCREGADGPWYLYGLTSWGRVPCGGVNEPTVFTRVTVFKNWIPTQSGNDIDLD